MRGKLCYCEEFSLGVWLKKYRCMSYEEFWLCVLLKKYVRSMCDARVVVNELCTSSIMLSL